MALLGMAAAWAKRAGRRLLAITVDHGLNPDSTDWSRRCEAAACAVGADWVERHWEGEKPTTGLPAAARRARHALIAEAARGAGAKVVLFAHTADDIAEADWMRDRGSTLGRLREWSPSPVWPEGRGLMLLRPMLDEGREDLRDWLREAGLDWIDDPANVDPRFGRARARADLAGVGAPDRGEAALPRPSTWHGQWWGGLELPREAPSFQLAAALLCAAGGETPPRGRRLDALRSRLSSPEDVHATLVGARVDTRRDWALVGREAGEFDRRGLSPLPLEPHRPCVWDGRFEITVEEPGWSVVAAARRWNGLDAVDRLGGAAVWPSFRGALPVLIRDDGGAPVLAWRNAEVRTLAPRRLCLALGETTQESDLDLAIHGETPPPDLF
jgi:tRNA(Ile)-lysidine synthase